jgi:hypothetical protein
MAASAATALLFAPAPWGYAPLVIALFVLPWMWTRPD